MQVARSHEITVRFSRGRRSNVFFFVFLISLKERREGKMYSGAQKDTKGIDEICKVDY